MNSKLTYHPLNPNNIFISKDIAILIYRVLLSVSMINTHGMKKLLHMEETIAHIPDPTGIGGEASYVIAIIANVIGPIFVILGLTTRLAILPILSVTLMGLFVVHVADPWPVKDVPLMYSLAYLFLFFIGPGKYSLDYKFFRRS